ncbi:Na+/H+ antiporter NhaA [Providencia alcalifaciens]|nr:Na+/H+ antiporter NhaA [Providencia alcalifaciens]
MVKINPFKLYLIAAFLLSLFCFYDSIIYYIDYFMMKDRIIFSFQTGLLCFAAPLIIYFSYLTFACGYTKKPQKMNNKLASSFAIIGIIGIIFSFFFSAYVSIDLTNKGYYTCYKSSIFAPNEYVISKEMCKQ